MKIESKQYKTLGLNLGTFKEDPLHWAYWATDDLLALKLSDWQPVEIFS